MRWPWSRREARASSGDGDADALTAALLAQGGGVGIERSALVALEVAAGLWARGFASATVEPATWRRRR